VLAETPGMKVEEEKGILPRSSRGGGYMARIRKEADCA
jgi:hypothetical protein